MERGSVRVREANPEDTEAIVAVTEAGWRDAAPATADPPSSTPDR